MGILLSATDLSKSFDTRTLFNHLSFVVESGERIGLIGPNGAGKSTLLRILADQIQTDEGEITLQRGLRISYIAQVPLFQQNANVLTTLLQDVKDPDDWEASIKVDELLWKLELEKAGIQKETLVQSLSGGWKKRLALARALMTDPDLLLMDEPTNHLDVESILWLEELIRTASFATITITHDRAFLQKVSNRILELDKRNPGGILSVKGDYATYLEHKESLMSAQEKQEASLKGDLRRETAWLRAGVKARGTKQNARLKRHGELRNQVSELQERNTQRIVQMEFQGAEKNPKRLIEAEKISKSYLKGRPLFSQLNLVLTPGKRLGILGANGCGKSTLIRVLLGLEKPDEGNVFRSDLLKTCYFEQNRESLDPKQTLLRTVCPYGDHVTYRGRQIHVRSYLDRFLFSKDKIDQPIESLSGGEQSRVLISKLMLEEANLLILDEPTNDLDLATLNVLQDCLLQFDGAIILVCHDRYFLDQTSTEILAFPVHPEDDSQGKLYYFADLSQWERWHRDELQAKS